MTLNLTARDMMEDQEGYYYVSAEEVCEPGVCNWVSTKHHLGAAEMAALTTQYGEDAEYEGIKLIASSYTVLGTATASDNGSYKCTYDIDLSHSGNMVSLMQNNEIKGLFLIIDGIPYDLEDGYPNISGEFYLTNGSSKDITAGLVFENSNVDQTILAGSNAIIDIEVDDFECIPAEASFFSYGQSGQVFASNANKVSDYSTLNSDFFIARFETLEEATTDIWEMVGSMGNLELHEGNFPSQAICTTLVAGLDSSLVQALGITCAKKANQGEYYKRIEAKTCANIEYNNNDYLYCNDKYQNIIEEYNRTGSLQFDINTFEIALFDEIVKLENLGLTCTSGRCSTSDYTIDLDSYSIYDQNSHYCSIAVGSVNDEEYIYTGVGVCE